VDDTNPNFNGRAHFFGADDAVRRILIGRALCKLAVRYGGDYQRADLSGPSPASGAQVNINRAQDRASEALTIHSAAAV
jgi:hypothetical protein